MGKKKAQPEPKFIFYYDEHDVIEYMINKLGVDYPKEGTEEYEAMQQIMEEIGMDLQGDAESHIESYLTEYFGIHYDAVLNGYESYTPKQGNQEEEEDSDYGEFDYGVYGEKYLNDGWPDYGINNDDDDDTFKYTESDVVKKDDKDKKVEGQVSWSAGVLCEE